MTDDERKDPPTVSDPQPEDRPSFDPSRYLTKISGRGGGGDYLTAAGRIAWFRAEWPSGAVDVEHVVLDETWAVMKATVTKVDAHGQVFGRASDYATEFKAAFNDYVEKASTSAVSRALRSLGYGTAEAMDEGAPTDAPINLAARRPDRAPTGDRAVATGGDPAAGWSTFWPWAKAFGLHNIDQVGRFLGRNAVGLEPSALVAAIEAAENAGAEATHGATLPVSRPPVSNPDPVPDGQPATAAARRRLGQLHGAIAGKLLLAVEAGALEPRADGKRHDAHEVARDLARAWHGVDSVKDLTEEQVESTYRQVGKLSGPDLAAVWNETRRTPASATDAAPGEREARLVYLGDLVRGYRAGDDGGIFAAEAGDDEGAWVAMASAFEDAAQQAAVLAAAKKSGRLTQPVMAAAASRARAIKRDGGPA